MRFWQNILALNICKLGNKCCFWSRHLAALVSSLLNKQSRLVMRPTTHYCFLTRWTSTFVNLRRKMIKNIIYGQILFSFPSTATGMYWLRLCLFFPSEQNVWHVKQISPRLMTTSTCLDTHDDAAALKLLEKMPLKKRSVRLTKKSSFYGTNQSNGDGWSFLRGQSLQMIICKRPGPMDDYLQETRSYGWSFASGLSLQMIICK